MATLYTEQRNNVRKTWILMSGFFLLITALGYVITLRTGSSLFLYIAVTISFLLNIYAYWFSDKMVLSMAGARPIEKREEYPELWNIVENLSITAGLPMPKLYVIDDPAPNAFATGRDEKHAVVAVTTGILPLLTKSELEGVIAHELSHIKNKDMLIATVVVVFAGLISILADILMRTSHFGNDREEGGKFTFVFAILASIIAPLAATILQLAMSRKREFLADASGALITRYPEGLASALEKISKFSQPMQRVSPATAHLFISNPLGGRNIEEETGKVSWFTKMFMTHPPTQERIDALLQKRQ